MTLIDKMANGQKEAIQEGLFSQGALVRANALVFSARNGIADHVFTARAKELEKDDTCLFGYNASFTVSDFAKAYLHLVGEKEYSGSREETKQLIVCKMAF